MIFLFLISSIILISASALIAQTIEKEELHIQILITGVITYGQICLVGRFLSLIGILSSPFAWLLCDLLFLAITLRLVQHSLNWEKIKEKHFWKNLFRRFRATCNSLITKQKESPQYILILLGIILVLLLAALLVATLFIPQNADDFLTAYLPRVGYWMQSDSLGLFEASTYNSPQSSYPLNAQIPWLRSIVLSGGDLFIGMDQWISALLSGTAIYGLSKFFGGNRGTSFFLAGIWLLTPSIATQIGVSLTDLYVIFLFLVAVLLGVSGWTEQRRSLMFLSSLSLALAVGSKHTVLFTAPALLLLAVIPLVSKKPKHKNAIFWVVTTVPMMFLLGIDRYLQNWRFFGHPFGDQDSFVLFTGEELNSFSDRFTRAIDNGERVLTNIFLGDLDFLPAKITDPIINNFKDVEPFLGTNISTNSGVPWLGVTTSIIVISGLLLTFYQIIVKRKWPLLILVLPALSYLGVLFLIRPSFSLAFSRYILLPIALLLAASGLGFSKVHSFLVQRSKKTFGVLTSFIALLAIVGGTIQTSSILSENGTRPLLGEQKAWGNNDLEMFRLSNGFGNRSSLNAVLNFVEDCFDKNSEIRVEYGGKFPQGLLFGDNYNRPVTQAVLEPQDIPEFVKSAGSGPVLIGSYSLARANELTNFLDASPVVVFGEVTVAYTDQEFNDQCKETIDNSNLILTAINNGLFDYIPTYSAIVNLATSLTVGIELGIYEDPLDKAGYVNLNQTPEETVVCGEYQMCTIEGNPIYILREIFSNGWGPNLLLTPMAKDMSENGPEYINNPLMVLSNSYLFGPANSIPNCQLEGNPGEIPTISNWVIQRCTGAPGLLSTFETFLSFGCTAELKGWYICN
jgi:hypothetical protein